MIDLPPPTKLWLPPKPAIIRPAPEKLVKANFLPGLDPGFIAAAAPAAGLTLTYLGLLNAASNGGSGTFTGANLGTPSADRQIVLGVMIGHTGDDAAVSAITVAGISASQIASSNEDTYQLSALWQAAVPSGSSGTIAATADFTAMEIAVWSLAGYSSATATVAAAANGVFPEHYTIATQAGGVLVACAHGGHMQAAFSVTGVAVTDSSGIDAFYDWYAGHSIGLSANAAHALAFDRDPSADRWQTSCVATWL